MRVYQINSFGNLSTGTIAKGIYRMLLENGHSCRIAYGRGYLETDISNYKIGNKLSVCMDGILTRLTDRAGFYSKQATRDLIKDIEAFNPDVIQLHNLHGYYINIEILFEYLLKSNIPVVWTLHDCWPFTGHCCYYSEKKCTKWKEICSLCIQRKEYPMSLIDNSCDNFLKKREIFCQLAKLRIVTVSKWLENEVRQSFLNKYSIKTIYNGINLNIYKPCNSYVLEKYKCNEKKIILGVASTWTERKGLKDFIKLNEILNEEFQIVLIGLNKKQIKKLPKGIIGLERTKTVQELIGWYSSSYIFFNASKEETFGLPTLEAQACQTPVIVYDATALPEAVLPGCGYVVEKNNVKKVSDIITNKLNHEALKKELKNDELIKGFSDTKLYKEYLKLYYEMTEISNNSEENRNE